MVSLCVTSQWSHWVESVESFTFHWIDLVELWAKPVSLEPSFRSRLVLMSWQCSNTFSDEHSRDLKRQTRSLSLNYHCDIIVSLLNRSRIRVDLTPAAGSWGSNKLRMQHHQHHQHLSWCRAWGERTPYCTNLESIFDPNGTQKAMSRGQTEHWHGAGAVYGSFKNLKSLT